MVAGQEIANDGKVIEVNVSGGDEVVKQHRIGYGFNLGSSSFTPTLGLPGTRYVFSELTKDEENVIYSNTERKSDSESLDEWKVRKNSAHKTARKRGLTIISGTKAAVNFSEKTFFGGALNVTNEGLFADKGTGAWFLNIASNNKPGSVDARITDGPVTTTQEILGKIEAYDNKATKKDETQDANFVSINQVRGKMLDFKSQSEQEVKIDVPDIKKAIENLKHIDKRDGRSVESKVEELLVAKLNYSGPEESKLGAADKFLASKDNPKQITFNEKRDENVVLIASGEDTRKWFTHPIDNEGNIDEKDWVKNNNDVNGIDVFGEINQRVTSTLAPGKTVSFGVNIYDAKFNSSNKVSEAALIGQGSYWKALSPFDILHIKDDKAKENPNTNAKNINTNARLKTRGIFLQYYSLMP